MAYDEDLRNQLTQIQQMGTNATNYAQQIDSAKAQQAAQAAADHQAQLQQAAQAKWQQQQAAAIAKQQSSSQTELTSLRKQIASLQQGSSSTTSSSGSTSLSPSGSAPKLGKGNNFENFVSAITSQESGGNYHALGQPVGGDRAYGRYQIMGNNIASWTKAALGKSLTPAQFLASPKAQDATARHFLQGYYNNYGPAGAAVAWYAGAGTAQKYVKNPSAYNGSQGHFPSINAYAMSILSKMGLK